MVLEHQEPLQGYDRRIGGSAGKNTYGGDISKPTDYPERNRWDYEVSTPAELVEHIQKDNVIVGLDPDADDFDIDDYNKVEPGENAILVGHYCNPDVDGRGPVLRKTHYDKCFLKTRQPFHMYGVSLRGPNRAYFDPRDRSDEKGLPESAWYTAGVWVMTQPNERTSRFVGCEFWGWTWAGAVLGAKNYETKARFERCSFHDCMMETMGYGASQFDGHAEFDLCFFDKCRHAIAGFGYDSETCRITRCVGGPGDWAGHVIDRHELTDENPVAGKWIRISDSTFMVDKDILGYLQEAVKLRGRPEKLAWIRTSHFTNKDEKPTGCGGPGEAWFQEGDKRRNFKPEDNHYGPELKAGYGAPLADGNNEKAADDKTNTETSDPDSSIPGRKLTLRGKEFKANYRIVVDGDVSKGSNPDRSGDSLHKRDDGTTVIDGFVSKYADRYQLAPDAQMIQFSATGPLGVEIDGEPVSIGDLVSADMQERVNELDGHITALSNKLDKAHIEF